MVNNNILNLVLNPNIKKSKLKPLYGGGDSDVFLLECNGKKYILKVYKLFSLRDVLAEIKVMNVLAKYSFSTPRPIKFRNQKQFFFYEEKPAIIYPYFVGKMAKEAEISEKICQEAGRLMAHIDRAMRKIKIPLVRNKKTEWDLMQFERVWPMLKFLPRRYNYLLPEIEQLFRVYRQNKDLLNELPKHLVLNDVSETNLLVANGKVSGLVDFSDMTYSPHICNLAIAAAHLCFDDKNWQKKLIGLVRAYQKINPLPQKHYKLLPLLIRCRFVTRLVANHYNGLKQKKLAQVQWMTDWSEKRLKIKTDDIKTTL